VKEAAEDELMERIQRSGRVVVDEADWARMNEIAVVHNKNRSSGTEKLDIF
jgi:hypothetical protein